ncbi:two-component system chemotaxis response regulator CheB [Kineothrix alysoides]|uniref:Protein-glutamate methylesterase/protein-glutamine glutaminase n=1 Tax=Kineothrix alysoides TaxID=1469948 RepID=A0A4R1QRN8_9FIRM|nr:chemotaxis response regulator protein-glutamate methylesterase [Kineothrix alysoides]TCL56536.1 two-component system chemotaxis response regulator CheB [Kineothrix alysoides]
MRQIKVLVVEDSIVFRNLLVQGLKEDPNIEVVGVAGDPFEAKDIIPQCKPDVMTLDIEMPKMNGIEFLRKLMPQYPMPVIMLSGMDGKVFDAMEAGAVDFAHKPVNMSRGTVNDFIRQELITKVKIASSVDVRKLRRTEMSRLVRRDRLSNSNCIIAIGASTGGTEAIHDIIKQFHNDIPGVVIVQHMPAGFTQMYADRMNNQCEVEVKEAQDGDMVKRGQVLIAPGGYQMRLVKFGSEYFVECKKEEKVSGHCPSVDMLFDSVAKTAGADSIGVILTGMGGDGSRGMKAMKNCGAVTIGQDEATSVVYGMPKVAYDIGAVRYQLPLCDIAHKIYSLLE